MHSKYTDLTHLTPDITGASVPGVRDKTRDFVREGYRIKR